MHGGEEGWICGEDFALANHCIDDAVEEAFVEGLELGFEFAVAGAVPG